MTSASPQPPAKQRSTIRLLLLGCAGLIAFCVAAFVVLVVVRAIQLGSAENRGSGVEAGESSTATSPPLTGGYREPSGCFAFDPGQEWKLVEETSLRAAFSADPDNPLSREPDPGTPGLWIEADCSPLDKVGTNWIPPIPGVTIVEKERVPFGGGRSTLYVLRYEGRGRPSTLQIDYSVDRNGARCGFTVEGNVDAVERFRPQFERAAATFVCAGR